MVKVFANNLTPEQEQCLNDRFGENWEVISLPNRGMSPSEAKEFLKVTRAKNCPAVFFQDSSACLLLAVLSYWNGFDFGNSFFGNQPKGDVYFLLYDENKWQLRDLTELL